MRELLQKVKKQQVAIDMTGWRKYAKSVMILFFIYLLGISSVIRANFYYIDDLGRAVNGYTGWEAMSRYVSVFLSYFIHADTFLADVSPLTQYIALLFVAIAAIIIIHLFQVEGEQVGWIQIVAAIPLALSPYFLECISYKYDAPYMALSILAGVMPLLLKNKNGWLYTVASIIGILTVCMTYQAALGVYPVLVVMLASIDWNRKQSDKRVLLFIGKSIFSFAAAVGIFYFLIMHEVDTYVSNSIVWDKLLFSAWENIGHFYKMIRLDFKNEWLVLIIAIAISYIWVFVRDSKRSKMGAACIGVASLMLMAVLAFGLYPILAQPSFEPRSMYGFTVFISILGIYVCSAKKIHWGKIACILLSWCFVVLSFVYGNALYAQAEYTNYRITMIAEDLIELDCTQTQQPVNIQVKGTIGYAAAVPNERIIRRLVPVYLREGWYWGIVGLCDYYGIDNLQMAFPLEVEMELNNPIRTVDNALYSFDVDGQNVLVTVK